MAEFSIDGRMKVKSHKKKIFIIFYTILIVATISCNAVASDGVIRFYGAIVDEPCHADMVKDNVTMKCGKDVETFKIGKNNETDKDRYTVSQEVISKNAKVLVVT